MQSKCSKFAILKPVSIAAESRGGDEQLWAFRQAFEDNIPVPCDGFVVGQPVSVLGFDYDGNEQQFAF